MFKPERLFKADLLLYVDIAFLMVFSIMVLRSIVPHVFPQYFLYIVAAILFFILFSKLDFEVLSLFSPHIYIFSIIFLLLPLFIGQVTRGAVRWINLGEFTIQPTEMVRPFLLVFLANYVTQREITPRRFFKTILLFALPAVLILIQPALGMTILFGMGFVGILLSSSLKKKYFLYALAACLIIIPVSYQLLAPYQRLRINTFLKPSSDPYGAGYNSIQSMISVGSGKIWGRGLGKGIQTQLAFLPEKHTDFIFAAIAEETGIMGAVFVILGEFYILYRLTAYMEQRSGNRAYRAYMTGLFLTLFVQTVIHIGMNVGLLPVTGLGLPLVSAGGSSLLGTMIGLGIALSYRKKGLNLE